MASAKSVEWIDPKDADSRTYEIWQTLYERQSNCIQQAVCREYLEGLSVLAPAIATLPDMGRLTSWLERRCGWTLVPVYGFLPSRETYAHFAERRMPVAANLRPPGELDYTTVPDVFHDVFGHLPLLLNPTYRGFLAGIGVESLAASEMELQDLERIYWFTIEVGMCREAGIRRLYGATPISSFTEIGTALSDQVTTRPFDTAEVVRTAFRIDVLQGTLFELPSFSHLSTILDDWRGRAGSSDPASPPSRRTP